MKVSELLALGSDLTETLVAQKLTDFALNALGFIGGPVSWLVKFVIKLAVKYFIWPGLEDLVGLGKVVIDCAKVDQSVEVFKGAESAKDKHDAFSNLG